MEGRLEMGDLRISNLQSPIFWGGAVPDDQAVGQVGMVGQCVPGCGMRDVLRIAYCVLKKGIRNTQYAIGYVDSFYSLRAGRLVWGGDFYGRHRKPATARLAAGGDDLPVDVSHLRAAGPPL